MCGNNFCSAVGYFILHYCLLFARLVLRTWPGSSSSTVGTLAVNLFLEELSSWDSSVLSSYYAKYAQCSIQEKDRLPQSLSTDQAV
jgi:hypothetical protein